MSGSEAANFIPILHDALGAAGFSNVTIICCDTMGWGSARTWAGQLMSAGMQKYLGVISSHGYTGEPTSPLGNTPLPVWQTEYAPDAAWCTTWYQNGGACEGMTWANKIHTGIVNANLSAYINWQGAEVNQFQASTYLVASDKQKVIPSGRLWAYAMWSRFVRPGARRLGTTGNLQGVGIGAFKNADGSYAVVLTNNGGAQNAKLSFNGFTPTKAQAYLIDNSHTVELTQSTVTDGVTSVAVPGRSVVTVLLL
jgi:O-glycosyl hydrolase